MTNFPIFKSSSSTPNFFNIICANCNHPPTLTPQIWQLLLAMPKYKFLLPRPPKTVSLTPPHSSVGSPSLDLPPSNPPSNPPLPRRLLRRLPNPRLNVRPQSPQQRPQPRTQRPRLLPTYLFPFPPPKISPTKPLTPLPYPRNRPRKSTISNRQHNLLLRRRRPSDRQPHAPPPGRRSPPTSRRFPPSLWIPGRDAASAFPTRWGAAAEFHAPTWGPRYAAFPTVSTARWIACWDAVSAAGGDAGVWRGAGESAAEYAGGWSGAFWTAWWGRVSGGTMRVEIFFGGVRVRCGEGGG